MSKQIPRGAWVGQLVVCLTLDPSSGLDLRIMSSSPGLLLKNKQINQRPDFKELEAAEGALSKLVGGQWPPSASAQGLAIPPGSRGGRITVYKDPHFSGGWYLF